MAIVLGQPPMQSAVTTDKYQLTPPWQNWFSAVAQGHRSTQTLTAILDPVSVAANTVVRQTFIVAGLTTSDIVAVNPPALTAGLEILNARVTATNTLQITFWNTTGAPIDDTANPYLILAVRQ